MILAKQCAEEMKRHEFKTKLNKTKKQKNVEIGGYTKLIRVDDELFFM